MLNSEIYIKSKWEIQFSFPFWVTGKLNMAPRIDNSKAEVLYTQSGL